MTGRMSRRSGIALAAAFGLMAVLPACADDAFDLYNEGRRLYFEGAYDSAAAVFSRAADGPVPELEGDAFYNLGNAHVKEAERLKDRNLPAAVKSLRTAVSAYTESLNRRPVMDDAKHNLELARLLLKKLEEELKKQQESQKNQKQKDGQSDTSASGESGDTNAASRNQDGSSQGPQDQGKSFDRKGAEKDMKERLKDIEELRQRLLQAARQKGVDPEREQDRPAGVIGGGTYKDW